MNKAEVITIGDEILYGQITDTNTQYLGEKLGELGIKIIRKSSVGDTKDAILQIIKEGFERADLLILTGGLGPTKDDITKATIAEFFNVGFKTDYATLEQVKDFFEKRNRPLLEINKLQAEIPSNAIVLPNKLGTAPGMWIEHNGKVLISLPGVPYEMKHIMETSGLEKIKVFFKPKTIIHKMIHTIGLGESFLAEKIKDWEENLPSQLKLAYLPSLGIVKLRLTAQGDEDRQELLNLLHQYVETLVPLIERYIFGYDEDGNFSAQLGKILKSKNLTIATAESCTGGYIGHMLTLVPGSSQYYKGSIIAYHNNAKVDLLNVNAKDIEQHGAVSEQVAKQMAKNVRLKLGTEIGIATTGIAGPDGGSVEKPVGTVWVAYSDVYQTTAYRMLYTSNRENNIKLSSLYALNLVRMKLLGLE
jgi:nicotinamide-nucleotide amidase